MRVGIGLADVLVEPPLILPGASVVAPTAVVDVAKAAAADWIGAVGHVALVLV
jgi:hypothetical protein